MLWGGSPMRAVPLAVVVLISTAATLSTSSEPVVHDKPLSDWIKQLHEPDAEKRVDAALAIARLGPKAKDAAADLCEVLKEDEGRWRWLVEHALLRIGPDAIPAL